MRLWVWSSTDGDWRPNIFLPTPSNKSHSRALWGFYLLGFSCHIDHIQITRRPSKASQTRKLRESWPSPDPCHLLCLKLFTGTRRKSWQSKFSDPHRDSHRSFFRIIPHYVKSTHFSQIRTANSQRQLYSTKRQNLPT